jgi:CubicO group peptidase (beta-lactamase class C family)
MNELVDIHSFMVLRHGKVAAEAWKAPYSASEPHMLYSLSKSFTSTAAGLAIGQGLLSLDTRVLDVFPEDAPPNPDVNLSKMKLRHLLCMGTGHHEDTTGRLRGEPDDVDGSRPTHTWVKAFLSLPVEHEPGTYFVYNSGASYMVSAMVQKAVGCTVLEYLEDKLFAPLGIHGATWDVCPAGINVGGWGLWIKTEDIARFGQLYLQDGVWNGVRILPEGWVANASAKHISNGDNPESDWNQGYCFQFWRCRHNAYRGDGAFGQYCVVVPDQQLVVAITAGLGDLQQPLNIIWDTLLPAVSATPLPADDAAAVAVKHKLNRLAIATSPQVAPSSQADKVISGLWKINANDDNMESVAIRINGDEVHLDFQIAGEPVRVVAGANGRWIHGEAPLLETGEVHIGSTATWVENDRLEVKVCFTRTPFVRTVVIYSTGDGISLEVTRNVSFNGGSTKTYIGRK